MGAHRRPVFRALWTAQAASYVGTWMQTVGAQCRGAGRQHSERLTVTDARNEAAAHELAAGRPVVSHLFVPDPEG